MELLMRYWPAIAYALCVLVVALVVAWVVRGKGRLP